MSQEYTENTQMKFQSDCELIEFIPFHWPQPQVFFYNFHGNITLRMLVPFHPQIDKPVDYY